MAQEQKDLSGVLLGVGNPLLDISAEVEQSMLDKYQVKAGNAILAEPQHMPVYDELCASFKPSFIAGGATQNSIRVAQWMLQVPGATAYMGCVGKDSYGDILKKAASDDGVTVHYQVDEKTPTGTCACLIVKNERSLIANVSAASQFKPEFFELPESEAIWKRAKYYYISGFFITSSPPSIEFIAKHSMDSGKTFMMNLAAPFICMVPPLFDVLMKAMPYVDIIFGNESEAEAFGAAAGLEDKDPLAVAKHIAQLEQKDGKKGRLCIITRGSQDTIVADASGKVVSYPVTKIPAEEIVDFNGAGDAFVGGFLSHYCQGKDMETCVSAGHYAAGIIIRTSGTKLTGKPTF